MERPEIAYLNSQRSRTAGRDTSLRISLNTHNEIFIGVDSHNQEPLDFVLLDIPTAWAMMRDLESIIQEAEDGRE